jgi:transcriptional regulator NrdR family protein
MTMRCPRCGEATKVTASRTSERPGGYKIARRAAQELSWFTYDWVARVRHCKVCPWREGTVEILLSDLVAGWKRRDGSRD